MKIVKILFHYLRNEAHYQFMLLVLKLFADFPKVAEIVTALISRLTDLVTAEGKLVDAITGSLYTEQLAEADHRIDRDIAGLDAAVESALHHYDPAFVEAAKALKLRLTSFHGEIRKKAYEEESAAVKILVAELKSIYSVQINLLGLDGWVTELEAAQTDFERIFLLRNKEMADRPQEQLRALRKEEDAIYHEIVERIDAYGTLNGYDVTGQFVKELNHEVTYFNEHTHRRVPKNIDRTTVAQIPSQTWTGEPSTPFPDITDEEGNKLVFARDYDLTYHHNDRPGTATLHIRGTGAWKGTLAVTFNIVATD
ncbi:MAG: DUF6261 family protein [Tannerella sp.]|jgi:hypothetical protein|nr:DUF6261 family protein [Tannerella sp.]